MEVKVYKWHKNNELFLGSNIGLPYTCDVEQAIADIKAKKAIHLPSNGIQKDKFDIPQEWLDAAKEKK